MINVKFSEFKKNILEDANDFFSKEGFKFNKGKQLFKKAIGKNYIEYSFDFLDYFPNWYEYNFGFSISIQEIEKIKKEFNDFNKSDKILLNSVFFFEGDFVEELIGKEYKYRSGHYNKISSTDDIKGSMSRILYIIREKALPLSYKFCDLSSFQEYYLCNKQEVIRNLASETLFISTLIAAYLKNTSEYVELSRFLKSELDIEKSKGSDYKQLYILLDKIDQFINHKIGGNVN